MAAFEGWNRLGLIAAAMPEAADKIIRKGAFDIEARAKRNIQANNQIATGFMVNSVYTATSSGSDYASAAAAASASAKHASQELFEEVPAPPVTEAVVAVGASYGAYQEFGTSRMPARPYLLPAAEAEAPILAAAFRQLEVILAGIIG